MKKVDLRLIILLSCILSFSFLTLQKNSVFAQEPTGTPISKKCKCKNGKKWNGKKCIKKSEEVCILLFDPVCGCNGMTYSNSCFAGLDGIKKFTNGECP